MTACPAQSLLVVYYQDESGRSPFGEWLLSLDGSLQPKIVIRLQRIALEKLGDWKSIGDGVPELKFRTGPGLRVYFGREGEALVLLLGGEDNRSQSKDIRAAKQRWKRYLAAKQQPEKIRCMCSPAEEHFRPA